MQVRRATIDDMGVIEELSRACEAEASRPHARDELEEIREIVAAGCGWIAETGGGVVGMALIRGRTPELARVTSAASFGSIHVQTDDVDAIIRALDIYVPRLPGRSLAAAIGIEGAGHGWADAPDLADATRLER